jgi:hypothetical protein
MTEGGDIEARGAGSSTELGSTNYAKQDHTRNDSGLT